MELKELKEMWQHYDKALQENKMLNEKIIVQMTKDRSKNLTGKMLIWEYINLSVCGLLVVVFTAMWRQSIHTEISAFFIIFFILIVVVLIYSLYKIRLLSSIDFGSEAVAKAFRTVERFRLLMIKERIWGISSFPVFFLTGYVVINFWFHHENIFSRLDVYAPRIIIGLMAGIAGSFYLYRKVYFDRILQLKKNLEEIEAFRSEQQ